MVPALEFIIFGFACFWICLSWFILLQAFFPFYIR